MLYFLRRLYGSLMQRKRNVVLVVPWDGAADHDAVRALAPYIVNKNRFPARVLLDNMVGHFLDALKPIGFSALPEKVVLFAHPTKNLQGFAVNSDGKAEVALLLRWWESQAPYGLVVAFVCRGAQILDRRLWRETFPSWVSFKSDINTFLATADGIESWVRICNGVVESAVASVNAQAAKLRIESLLTAEMAHLYDNTATRRRNMINIIYLENCIEALVSSEG